MMTLFCFSCCIRLGVEISLHILFTALNSLKHLLGLSNLSHLAADDKLTDDDIVVNSSEFSQEETSLETFSRIISQLTVDKL